MVVPTASGGAPAIEVLSNRPDLISGGDVLIEIVLPLGVPPTSAALLDDGGAATATRGLDTDGRFFARVTSLDLGANVLTARLPGGAEASATIVNHPNGGPVFSGPQIQPWTCQAGAVDAQCNYGLEALRGLLITPAQFVDLNVKIGGLDIDIQPSAARLQADQPALANAYRSGAINDGSHLDSVAIINATGPDPGIAHDSVHTWWMRWRLDREHGHHDNHVIWGGPAPLIGDPNYTVQSLVAMDRWLAAIEQDTSDTPLPQKVVSHKPADIHDQCSDGAGHKVLDDLCPEAVIPVYGTPRTVAGDVDTADNMKCQRKPLNRNDDYGPLGLLTFTDEQWTQLETLYADGVCDYSVPGVSKQSTITWLSYQDGTGDVIYGGTPLPPAPVGVAPGWVSEAFYMPEPSRGLLLGAGIALLTLLGRARRRRGVWEAWAGNAPFRSRRTDTRDPPA